MSVKLSLLGYTPDGFKVSGSAEGETMTDALGDYASLQEFAKAEGWIADGMSLAAAKTFAAPSTNTTASSGVAPVCIYDGVTLTDVDIQGKLYTAQDLGTGRASKLRELGVSPAGPVCGDCWKSKGHANAWKAHYESKPKRRY